MEEVYEIINKKLGISSIEPLEALRINLLRISVWIASRGAIKILNMKYVCLPSKWNYHPCGNVIDNNNNNHHQALPLSH